MDQPNTQSAHDVCALPLVRRLAAMLDRDPEVIVAGDPLPPAWHAILFNQPTRQSELRRDGAAELGVSLPDIGLPRLMLAGRQQQFLADIPVGVQVSRRSRASEATLKQGKSGQFALVGVEHHIFVEDASEPAIIDVQQYVLRPAVTPSQVSVPAQAPAVIADLDPRAAASRILTPDERLLFRYSAITDNPHRIHYDREYTRTVEGYPDLVVNGTIPLMFLLELLGQLTRERPKLIEARNVAPMFCNHPLRLSVQREAATWRLWAQDAAGQLTFEARVR